MRWLSNWGSGSRNAGAAGWELVMVFNRGNEGDGTHWLDSSCLWEKEAGDSGEGGQRSLCGNKGKRKKRQFDVYHHLLGNPSHPTPTHPHPHIIIMNIINSLSHTLHTHQQPIKRVYILVSWMIGGNSNEWASGDDSVCRVEKPTSCDMIRIKKW